MTLATFELLGSSSRNEVTLNSVTKILIMLGVGIFWFLVSLILGFWPVGILIVGILICLILGLLSRV